MSEDKKQAPEQNFGPGNVLRAKREEYEWSVEAVAEALHLSTHAIKAIEADRYDDLPGSTYVVGYWRSYARLLGIDIEETIEVNKRNLQVVTAEPSGMDINRLMQRKKSGSGMGWLIMIIIFGGAVYFAWQQQFFGLFDETTIADSEEAVQIQNSDEAVIIAESSVKNKQTQVLRPIVNEAENAVKKQDQAQSPASKKISPTKTQDTQVAVENMQAAANIPGAGQPLTSGQSGLVLVPVEANVNAASIDKQGQDLLQAQTGMQGMSIAPALPKPGASPTTAVASTDETRSNPGVLPASQPAQASGPVTAGGSATSMMLTLSKDSWLDIRDKSNKRLLYKTEAAGQTIEVKGTPPFYVYIGTPDGVSIRYQGKNVPFETHKSGLFARFKLGTESLEAL